MYVCIYLFIYLFISQLCNSTSIFVTYCIFFIFFCAGKKQYTCIKETPLFLSQFAVTDEDHTTETFLLNLLLNVVNLSMF